MTEYKAKIVNGICVIFAIILTYFLVSSIIATRYQQLTGIIIADTAVAATLVIGSAWFFRRRKFTNLIENVSSKRILIPLFAGIFIIHLYLAFSLAIHPINSGWDPTTVFEASVRLAHSQPLSSDEMTYFGAYPNNVGIVALITIWQMVIHSVGITNLEVSLLILNVFVMNIALILTYLVAKRVAGKGAALLALMLGLIFITFSLWSRTFYTDTIGLLFPIACIYFVIRVYDAQTVKMQVTFATLLGITAGIGYLMKPTVVFVLIAAALVYGFKLAWSRRLLQKYFVIAVVIILGFLTPIISINAFISKKMAVGDNAMPLTSFVMLGLSKVCTATECRYGAWNLPDALQYDKYHSADEYHDFTISQIKSRLLQYGPVGYWTFLTEKGAWILGDGTFYAYHEGTEREADFVHKNPLTSPAQSFMHPSGSGYFIFQNLLQIFWLGTLFLVLAAFAVRRTPISDLMKIIYITLFGLILFLLLFEARSRYLYLYLPLFIVAAAYGMSVLLRRKSNPHRGKRV